MPDQVSFVKMVRVQALFTCLIWVGWLYTNEVDLILKFMRLAVLKCCQVEWSRYGIRV